MLEHNQNPLYQAFGLTIRTAFRLPELAIARSIAEPDVTILKSDLSRQWAALSEPGSYFYAEKNRCLFIVPEVAVFKIENGNTITVSPFQDVYDNQLRLYILGTCMGTLLMQREILPLHGSVIAIDAKAYAIVGDSGAGKSTLASAFLQRGHALLTDDVIAVTLDADNMPIVTPSYPQQKLWQESLNHFGMESANFRPLIDREKKFAIPVKEQFVSAPMPLAGIIELIKKEDGYLEIKPIQNLERLHKLFIHTYRYFLVERSGLMNWHFGITVKMAEKLDCYQIIRPSTKFTAHELVDRILDNCQKGERAI